MLFSSAVVCLDVPLSALCIEYFITALRVLTLANAKGHQRQNVHAEKDAPRVAPGAHFHGAIKPLMSEPMRQQQSRAGDRVSHDITELQIGGCLKITLIFVLLRTFGGE